MNRFALGMFASVLLALGAFAQPPSPPQNSSPETNPVSNAVRSLIAMETKNVVAAVEEMPPDKFGFRPTPPQNTFGHLVVHMIGANYGLCSIISGVTAPQHPNSKDDDPKDQLVPALKASFDFCAQSMQKLDDSELGDQVKFFGGRPMSRGMVVIIFAQDYGDHYSQAASYLRLNGLLPPTAQQQRPK